MEKNSLSFLLIQFFKKYVKCDKRKFSEQKGKTWLTHFGQQL